MPGEQPGTTETVVPAAPAAPAGGAAAPALGAPAAAPAAAPVAPAAPAPALGEQPKPDAKTETKPAPAAAPAEVELKLPAGFDAKDPGIEKFRGMAKEFGLKSDQAQKLFDQYVEAQAPIRQAVAELEAEHKSWVEATKADKDIGGDKYDQSLKLANATLNRFPSGPKVGAFLIANRFGGQPDLVKLFVEIGRSLSEDSTAGNSNGAPKGGALTAAQILELQYPTMFKGKGQ